MMFKSRETINDVIDIMCPAPRPLSVNGYLLTRGR
jgi:hypothetical protein